MSNRYEAALRAALAERDRLSRQKVGEPWAQWPIASDWVVTRIVEAALTAADAHDEEGEAVLCSDGSRVHDFQGERVCPGCGWAGIFAAAEEGERA